VRDLFSKIRHIILWLCVLRNTSQSIQQFLHSKFIFMLSRKQSWDAKNSRHIGEL